MGISYARTERRVLDTQTGRVLTANWHDYKIPMVLDVPSQPASLPIDLDDQE